MSIDRPILDKLKRFTRSFIRRYPPIEHFGKQFLLRTRYRTERALIRGDHTNSNVHPSILHFSFNRSATQYVKSILRRCATQNGLVPVAMNDYAFHSDFPFLDHLSPDEMRDYQHIFKEKGYLYSAFGGMVENIPNMENYKVFLVTRDPRDILVSSYYSIAYSHGTPAKRGNKYNTFLSRRQSAKDSTIDEFVLAESERLYHNFRKYQIELLDSYKDIYVASYEAMVNDFESWLSDLLKYCELSISDTMRAALVEEHYEKIPRTEDIHRHVRKGQPGDYKEKLLPDTIKFLNHKFAPVLCRYGYSQE